MTSRGRLALQADVVIDNFSVGVLDRWGIGYDAVSPEHPGVIYVGMSGMGTSGPWSKYVTYAPTVHALAGLTYLTGVPGRNDIGIGFSYNDHMAGLHGAVAVLAALEGRRLTGKGQRIDMSQFEVGVNFGGPALLNWFANGVAAEPVGNDPPWESWSPHAIYPCRGEDQWCAIAVVTDEQWQSLCRMMGADDWLDDGSADHRRRPSRPPVGSRRPDQRVDPESSGPLRADAALPGGRSAGRRRPNRRRPGQPRPAARPGQDALRL